MDLSNQLKENKRAYRIACSIMVEVKKKADDFRRRVRKLQSDLIAAKEMEDLTLEEEREQHRKILDGLKELNKEDIRGERQYAARWLQEKLDKVVEQHGMVQNSLQQTFDNYVSDSKQQHLDFIKQLQKLENQLRVKFNILEDGHVTEMSRVKKESRQSL